MLHQMRVLLLNGSLPEKAPLAEVSEERSQVSTSATRIGSEVDLGELRKIFLRTNLNTMIPSPGACYQDM